MRTEQLTASVQGWEQNEWQRRISAPTLSHPNLHCAPSSGRFFLPLRSPFSPERCTQPPRLTTSMLHVWMAASPAAAVQGTPVPRWQLPSSDKEITPSTARLNSGVLAKPPASVREERWEGQGLHAFYPTSSYRRNMDTEVVSGTTPGLTRNPQTKISLLLPKYRKHVLSDSLDKCDSEKCPIDVMRMSQY